MDTNSTVSIDFEFWKRPKPETLEIFFTDLKPVIQQKYLDFLGVQSPSDENLDCFPIAIVNKGQKL